MSTEKPFYELDLSDEPDPEATPMRDRKVITQPYDLSIDAIVGQVNRKILFLRPLSDRPNFQRQYVWPDKLASRLVESVLLNVPIPPCYLSENEECELDVIDGQQRIFSIYRYVENQFKLQGLEALTEFNNLRFFELPSREQRMLMTHTLRCVVIKNESHPEIKFDVFERLNTSTMPLNAQELRNCVSRGELNKLLGELSYDAKWLAVRGRKNPDKRLADEEMILRFFAFRLQPLAEYKTPLKNWLNNAAREGRKFDRQKIESLRQDWSSALSIALIWFDPNRCFRRPGSKAINRALFDLIMSTAHKTSLNTALDLRAEFLDAFNDIIEVDDFQDLISRSVDHKSRTEKRFKLWNEKMAEIGL
ncbi:Protein of unknown function DUF262 [Sulfitobacter brevis]|uniref:GmrSD restriction endonucleases N-terminal domain-containing protein n=1 Tax=Sulfitobacter brevis TaxID=74348 RepID=A0A1I2G404_9RHOB|nr:DUF262 domain-containing protein [Sulfitobacter brevis]SFF11710.1 Protein of unknown function DUF262 [Sulfitobacter brevis]